MDTIVCPHAPIVIGLSLRVLAVFVVQEGDDLVQHRLGYRKPRAKRRACKVECEVGTNSVLRNEIFEAPSVARIRIVVKIHPFVDLLVDSTTDRSCKLLLGQCLAGFDLALEEKLVAGDSDPVDVAEPASNAHADAVLGVIELSGCCVTPS